MANLKIKQPITDRRDEGYLMAVAFLTLSAFDDMGLVIDSDRMGLFPPNIQALLYEILEPINQEKGDTNEPLEN